VVLVPFVPLAVVAVFLMFMLMIVLVFHKTPLCDNREIESRELRRYCDAAFIFLPSHLPIFSSGSLSLWLKVKKVFS
jgi:hypothetical protein